MNELTLATKSKLNYELDCIRANNLNLYMNLKYNIHAVFQKMLMDEAEQAFFSKSPGSYFVYSVDDDQLASFGRFLGIENLASITRCVLYKRDDIAFVTTFFLNAQDYIVNRVSIFGETNVCDVQYTFEPHLTLLHTPESRLEEDKLYDF